MLAIYTLFEHITSVFMCYGVFLGTLPGDALHVEANLNASPIIMAMCVCETDSSSSNQNPLDLIQAHVIAATVIELGGAG